MPGGVALLRWQRRDESGRGGIVKREKRQTLSAVEAGDGTRREAADPSVAVVEQNRPSELARHDAILAGARSAALGWARRKRLVGSDSATRIASSKRPGRTTPINAAPPLPAASASVLGALIWREQPSPSVRLQSLGEEDEQPSHHQQTGVSTPERPGGRREMASG
jgi:hypothetical protein